MKDDHKQTELNRCRDILRAMVNYRLERYRGIMVLDGVDDISNSFEQERERIEKNFKLGRLDRLQKKLLALSSEFENTIDINIADYIKETTGYAFDLFEDLRKRIDAIMARREITNVKELSDISSGIRLLEKTSGDPVLIEKMKLLIVDYAKGGGPTAFTSYRGITKEATDVTETTTEKDGLVITRVTIGSKPKNLKEQEAIAPDGKRKVVVARKDGKYSNTYVTMAFPSATPVIYAAKGICPDIRASWKDNSTIVITTRKIYEVHLQHREVRSFDDVITIEYVEK
jgi:hypothetical protein